jgi:azurin
MKRKVLSALVAVAALFAGVAQVSAGEPREIRITANDTMRFDVAEITAAPGETLRVTLVNAGNVPKMAMGHNWVLLTANANVAQFLAAAAGAGLAAEFIPAAFASQIVAHTKLLGPRESDTITVTVPSAPGDYPFLCSFTGHSGTMKGVLKVQ